MVLIKNGTNTVELKNNYRDMWSERLKNAPRLQKRKKEKRQEIYLPYNQYINSEMWEQRRSAYFRKYPKRCVKHRNQFNYIILFIQNAAMKKIVI